MGYILSKEGLNKILSALSKEYMIFAPKIFENGNKFSDLPLVRYGRVNSVDEIAFDAKSSNSFKETFMPISQTLFFFTEDAVKEADSPLAGQKGAIVFLRSCDIHALKRLDEIYLNNSEADYYYKRVRDKIKFVLLPCKEPFASCFCVDMQSNKTESYDASVEIDGENTVCIDCKNHEWDCFFKEAAQKVLPVTPSFVVETKTRVSVPEQLSAAQATALGFWAEYDGRCINCGRCNFSCPTCTCYTMQDLFYSDNGRAGERRRVWASCMVDGFTDVAGGGAYRKKNGERMRFKALHKVLDFKQRFGYTMCVGCGRCDDICPEYISFSTIINRLSGEVTQNGGE
ncbi:sulfite reductase, subunit A [Treponema primitia ZAS-2]|uniref:Sulfite reductase, subunit A n=1 Tax=Treponema primitia (strain ATCC BAA-887 / DSM 12427 / ZAS-2) TaxID=545694 RepID=F5YMW6_TREPZ|nr:anaerobic sulfite reductase subunit AsrA [Treponema primitia]AEF83632.1 sulfite reductase, subunit A [Treponema primitia ZAS-2]